VGFQTQIEATIAGETFSTTGVAALGLQPALCRPTLLGVSAPLTILKVAPLFGAALRPAAGWLLHVGSQCLNTLRPSWHYCREHRPHAPEAQLDAGHGNIVSGL
jgi:hypothetical protein